MPAPSSPLLRTDVCGSLIRESCWRWRLTLASIPMVNPLLWNQRELFNSQMR